MSRLAREIYLNTDDNFGSIMNVTDSLERVRDAGLLERYHISSAEVGFITCVASPATYSSRSGEVLGHDTVLRALKQVILAHPILCVQIGGRHDKKPYFARLPQIDLSDVLDYTTDVTKSVEEVVNAEVQNPFSRSATKPLWRVTARTDGLVVFSWDHSIGDGGCAHSFHAAFLTALNSKPEADDSSNSTVITVPDKLAVAPTIEERISTSISLKTLLETLYTTFAPHALTRLRTAWTANAVSKEPDLLQNQTRIRLIDPDTARRLVILCREKKCTFTAFIHTLALLALSYRITTSQKEALGKKKKYKTFSTAVAVSLRRFTGIPPLDFCDHVSLYSDYSKITRDIPQFPPTGDSFPWHTAAKFTTSLHAGLKKSPQRVGTIGLIYKLGMANSYFLDFLGHKREHTTVISNIGAMPKLVDLGEKQRDDGELWQFDNVGFGQNISVNGPAIVLSMAGSPSGAISAVYNWGSNNIDSELVETIVADIHDSILTILAVSDS